MSAISTSSGEGLSRSSLRPDSMRCQARSPVAAFLRPTMSGDVLGLLDIVWLSRALLAVSGQSGVAMARHQMIVDHADRLHEGIHDRRPDELETARRQFFRHLA